MHLVVKEPGCGAEAALGSLLTTGRLQSVPERAQWLGNWGSQAPGGSCCYLGSLLCPQDGGLFPEPLGHPSLFPR